MDRGISRGIDGFAWEDRSISDWFILSCITGVVVVYCAGDNGVMGEGERGPTGDVDLDLDKGDLDLDLCDLGRVLSRDSE